MEYFLVAIAGWCGTGWPIRFPGVPIGGGGPDDPWPDNCPPCGGVISGVLGAEVIYYFVGRAFLARLTYTRSPRLPSSAAASAFR